MRLIDVYDVELCPSLEIRYSGSIKESSYPKNIVLEFNGVARIEVYIGDILIEHAISENKYELFNFKYVAFPYEIYPLLNFVVDIPYTVSYIEMNATSLVRQLLQHKKITYKLDSYKLTFVNKKYFMRFRF